MAQVIQFTRCDAAMTEENRVTQVEREVRASIAAGFLRIEEMIHREISQLKTEQIARLDKQLDRLADDQRRLWERVEKQQERLNSYSGGFSALHSAALIAGPILGSILGAGLTLIVTHWH